jgi:hypothetical protein
MTHKSLYRFYVDLLLEIRTSRPSAMSCSDQIEHSFVSYKQFQATVFPNPIRVGARDCAGRGGIETRKK